MSWWRHARINTHQIRLTSQGRLQTAVINSEFALQGLLHNGCRHRHLGWPQQGEQACLDCGARWSYDWVHMHRGAPARLQLWAHRPHPPAPAALPPSSAAPSSSAFPARLQRHSA